MKILRKIITVFIFLFLFLQSNESFSRAGGGTSGGGGGGGYSGGGYYSHGYYYGYGHGGYREEYNPVATSIVIGCTVAFFTIAFAGIAILIRMRSKVASRQLKKAAVADSFWNEEEMLRTGIETYHKMQEAWNKNDLSSVFHLITNDMFIHHQHFLSRYSKMNLKNVIKDVEIDTAKIVKVIDKDEDDKDTFLIYFKGKMIDYLVNTKTGIVVDGDKNSASKFEDIYVFFRHDGKWLLNQIINDPSSSYMREVKENKGVVKKHTHLT